MHAYGHRINSILGVCGACGDSCISPSFLELNTSNKHVALWTIPLRVQRLGSYCLFRGVHTTRTCIHAAIGPWNEIYTCVHAGIVQACDRLISNKLLCNKECKEFPFYVSTIADKIKLYDLTMLESFSTHLCCM